MKAYIYTGNRASKSAVALSKAMWGKRIKKHNSNFVPTISKAVINWGSSVCPDVYLDMCGLFLNKPEAINIASNKLSYFITCKTIQQWGTIINVPDWTVNKTEAEQWVNDGSTVVCRNILTGHSGDGIIICEDTPVPDVPLYVKYIKKKHEYRIHFIGSTDNYFVQRKARRHGFENPNWMVRNTAGGFIYVNDADNVGPVPDNVLTQAKLAFECSTLDFGAVDVIWNDSQNKAYVLEINTAPGLEGRTLEFYRDSLLNIINN